MTIQTIKAAMVLAVQLANYIAGFKCGRRFSIEIESDNLRDLHLEETEFSDWEEKFDGSIGGHEFAPHEGLRLCGKAGLYALDRFLSFLFDEGLAVDERCGFHVHIDVEDLSDSELQSVALGYHYLYRLLEYVVAPHRVDCYYSRNPRGSRHDFDFKPYTWRSIQSHYPQVESYNRYYAVNWASLPVHNSLEIRMLEGTLDGSKIFIWIMLNCLFVERIRKYSLAKITRLFGSKSQAEMVEALGEVVGTDLVDLLKPYIRDSTGHRIL